MSTFKQKSLFAALAGMGVLGVVDSAQAVHINQDGLGQALVYPYYTARSTASNNAYTTALSVVNTTASAKAVKVRFLEGKNSREVLDFNLFLSQFDVWTAGVVPAGAAAGIFTTDRSCTSPQVSRNSAAPTLFRNGAYVGDGGGDTLDRTYEGYFEILEMGSIIDGTPLQVAVTHKQDTSAPNASTPPGCNSTAIPTGNTCTACALPSGGLMGTASLINVNEGTDFSYDAVALDGWSNQVQFSSPGDTLPNISNASPATSVVIDNTSTGGRAVVTNWGVSGRDAVSAIMMRARVYNEYTVEPQIKGATDWVITMPTKRFYITTTTRLNPFENPFRANVGSCDLINLTYYDREEQSPGAIIDFSPTTPESRSMCWEANVLTFTANEGAATASNVFVSKNFANVGLKTPWINGWADLSFPENPNGVAGAHTLPAPAGATTFIPITVPPIVPQTNQTVTYFGLPIVGFAAQSYSTTGLPGVNPNVLSNYGGTFMHKYLRGIR